MSVDYSMLHNSVEAIAARVNFEVAISSLKMMEDYFEQVRDANKYGAEASRHTAQASQSMHNEMADQLHQQYIEHSVHAAANGGMAFGYAYKEGTTKGSEAQAQKSVDAAQKKLDALKTSGNGDMIAKAKDGKDIEMTDKSAAKEAEREAARADAKFERDELMKPGKDHSDHLAPEFDRSTGQLTDRHKQAIETMTPKEKRDFERVVRRDSRAANKKLQSIQSGKSQFYDQVRTFQQLGQTAASAKTEYERALDQKMVGQYEAMKNLAEWTNQAFQLTSQLATTMNNTLREQGVSSIANLTNALIQSNRAA